ncbi:MAG: acyl-CoA dehydrogenase family protein [Rhodospirillales bacterium]
MRDGDHYVVTGQKIWTTQAQHADWMFALVRTDPAAKPQRGISFLLIDMASPGSPCGRSKPSTASATPTKSFSMRCACPRKT